jgi:predicted dehydrogenase
MASPTRRQFIGRSLGAAVSSLGWTACSRSRIDGSNSDIRAAVIGFNGRGGEHINAFSSLPGVRLVALCDCDQAVLDKGAAMVKEKKNLEVKTFRDLRKLLEEKEIDVVSIATPNHWHSLAAIWAVQAGRDVYLEKPVSHNIWEGRQLVNAARKQSRIVQTGTQCRSSLKGIGQSVKWVQEGNLGKITLARGLCYKRRESIGKRAKPLPEPASVDYDLWCGPAEKLPIQRRKLHYDWHWIWNTGNGDLGNQGIHQMDICRWFLGESTLASTALSVGGRLGYDDDGETANTQLVFHGYEKAPLLFEVRGLETDGFMGAKVGCVIHCEGGYVVVPSYSEAIAYDKEGKKITDWNGSVDHFANFLDAVRSRKPADLHADVLEGHVSSALCHVGNIAHRLGATKSPEEIRAAVAASTEFSATVDRMNEHLAKNGVDCAKTPVTLGMPLTLDVKSERFIGDDAANALLTRNYREGFVVPAITEPVRS